MQRHRPVISTPFWRTEYDEASRSRPGRASISYDDVAGVLTAPFRTERQADGRVRFWGFVQHRGRWLRVVTLDDGQTVLNAFWDRRFRP
jgi:hypothetical protein